MEFVLGQQKAALIFFLLKKVVLGTNVAFGYTSRSFACILYTAFGYDVSLGLKLIQLDVVVGLMSFGDTVGISERYIQ